MAMVLFRLARRERRTSVDITLLGAIPLHDRTWNGMII